MVVQEIATYTSKDKFRKMPACREDLEKLKEMGYEAERFFYVDKARVGEGFRNQGFGKKLYNGAFEEMRKQIGQPFIIMPTWCLGAGGTSQAARRVWDSITRDHISSGHVIYIP
jgi:predicted GNAT family acetyltransferase